MAATATGPPAIATRPPQQADTGVVAEEMPIHPTALASSKQGMLANIGSTSPPPTPPPKDDDDLLVKQAQQPSSQDFDPLTADAEPVHNDSHAKSVESVEPGASTHEPKPAFAVSSSPAASLPSQPQEQSPSGAAAVATPSVDDSCDKKASSDETSLPPPPVPPKSQQKARGGPVNFIEQTETSGDAVSPGGNGSNAGNGVKLKHGATGGRKKKPLLGFFKKTSTDKDVKRKVWQFWK